MRNNQGTVHLQCMSREMRGAVTATPTQFEIVIRDCGLVTVTDCVFPGVGPGTGNGLRVIDCDHVVFQGCRLLPDLNCASSNVLTTTDSMVTFVDCLVSNPGLDAPIHACGSTIRLAGVTTVATGSNGSIHGIPLGSCTAPPTVQISAAATVGPINGATAVATVIPALSASFDFTARLMSADIYGDPASFTVLFAGPRLPVPTITNHGELWIDPSSAHVLAALPPGTPWRGRYSAAQPCPLTAWLQAATVGPAGIFLTNPSVLTFP